MRVSSEAMEERDDGSGGGYMGREWFGREWRRGKKEEVGVSRRGRAVRSESSREGEESLIEKETPNLREPTRTAQ